MSSSGSDSGDEDYVPSDCGSQPPSEVESDGDEEDSDVCDGDEVKNGQKGKKSKKGKVKDIASEAPIEKEEDNEDIKQKTESLWSDFLKDVSSDGGTSKGDIASETKEVAFEKKTVTKVYEFAGEKVTVSKEITEEVPSKKQKNFPEPAKMSENVLAEESTSIMKGDKVDIIERKDKTPVGFLSKKSVLGLSDKSHVIVKPNVRSGGSSLSSALDKLGKKNKLSTLEKSKLDWESYKNKEGITEDINAHNKGKSGYLDKRDFLEKTDLKQYELEKQLRNSQRRKL